jgi:hypothetical protein
LVTFDPNTLYSKADLQGLLGDRLGVEAFLLRLRPVRRFKNLYWGHDILDALAKCPPLDEKRPDVAPPILRRKEVKRHAQDHSNSDRISRPEVLARRN